MPFAGRATLILLRALATGPLGVGKRQLVGAEAVRAVSRTDTQRRRHCHARQSKELHGLAAIGANGQAILGHGRDPSANRRALKGLGTGVIKRR
jgi:hypothetical protein